MSTSCGDQGLEKRVAVRGKRALWTEEMGIFARRRELLCLQVFLPRIRRHSGAEAQATVQEGETEPRPWRALPSPSWITHTPRPPSQPHTCSLHVSPVPQFPPNPGPGSRDAPSPAYHDPFCKHSKETSPHLLRSSHLLRLLHPHPDVSRLARLLLPSNLRD